MHILCRNYPKDTVHNENQSAQPPHSGAGAYIPRTQAGRGGPELRREGGRGRRGRLSREVLR